MPANCESALKIVRSSSLSVEYDHSTAARSVGPQLDLSCGRVAFERFTPDGPVALLPFGQHYALVWTLPPDMAKEVLALDDAAFLVRLHSHFGDRLGNFIATGKR